MSKFIHASIPLAHETLSREEVAERLLRAAELGGYQMDTNTKWKFPQPDRTHFIVYKLGAYSGFYDHWGEGNPQRLTLEEFEEHCQELAISNTSLQNLIPLIQQWGRAKGITDPHKQLLKTLEELGELSSSLLKGKREEEVDAVGDVLVCLSVYCDIRQIDISDALNAAYNIIAKRTGKNVDGVFVKDETN